MFIKDFRICHLTENPMMPRIVRPRFSFAQEDFFIKITNQRELSPLKRDSALAYIICEVGRMFFDQVINRDS